ncbi:hypothetical protein [uncultured Aquimarina sp.]|uniref:hypothetical protein n=1 Tax=uncultured Aquimarina sp. TaxID=575652 RepID=UPI0026280A98|nr:hypothetical protein [uncultured Aquimarina sp.]
MENEALVLDEKGYPLIKIWTDHVEIKAIDYSEFRTFKYSNIKDIEHYDPNNNWWTKLYMLTSLTAQIFSKNDPWVLKIILKNRGNWTYKTSPKQNSEFSQTIRLLKMKVTE